MQSIQLCYCQREASITILLLVHTSYDQTGHIPQVFLSENFSRAQQEPITKAFKLNLYSKEHLFCACAPLLLHGCIQWNTAQSLPEHILLKHKTCETATGAAKFCKFWKTKDAGYECDPEP